MSDKFIKLTDGFYVSPQINEADIEAAKTMGISLIICNRPDGEEPGQPENKELHDRATELGLKFAFIPVDQRGISKTHIHHFLEATADEPGPILAFCRSGTRSTTLRAFARASEGANINDILTEAANAGYDLYPMAPGLEAAASRKK